MLNKQKHEIIMRNLLKDFYKSPYLSTRLGFKGGTAAYFFYDLPRFSVDLDFDLLIDSPTAEDFEVVRKTIGDICGNYGKMVSSRVKNYTVFNLLRYESSLQALKVEVSKRPKISRYGFISMLGVAVNTMVKEDMFANKLVALTSRKAPASRDLFDVNFFFSKLWDINEEIVKSRTGKDLREYLGDARDYIVKNFNKINVMAGLGEVLDKPNKDRAKDTLISDTLFKIDSFLASRYHL